MISSVLIPVILTITLAGVLAALVQGVPTIVIDRIAPDTSRISVFSGWRRIFGLSGLVDVLKATVKIGAIGVAVTVTLLSDWTNFVDAMRIEPSSFPHLLLKLSIHLCSVVSLCLAVLAMGDVLWTRIKWRRDLRMSRQEIKDELKQTEGDPLVKARMRSIAMDRARRRMIASVDRASFVVVNPTHYAVALRYRREEGGAPLVLAKGKDLIAQKIREVATANGVPILERRELARAMFEICEVDKMIPEEFYRPIAELINFLDKVSANRRH